MNQGELAAIDDARSILEQMTAEMSEAQRKEYQSLRTSLKGANVDEPRSSVSKRRTNPAQNGLKPSSAPPQTPQHAQQGVDDGAPNKQPPVPMAPRKGSSAAPYLKYAFAAVIVVGFGALVYYTFKGKMGPSLSETLSAHPHGDQIMKDALLMKAKRMARSKVLS